MSSELDWHALTLLFLRMLSGSIVDHLVMKEINRNEKCFVVMEKLRGVSLHWPPPGDKESDLVTSKFEKVRSFSLV